MDAKTMAHLQREVAAADRVLKNSFRRADEERRDAVEFLRFQASVCVDPARVQALVDAAQSLENGTHVGAAGGRR